MVLLVHLPAKQRGCYCFQQCPFLTLSVCLFVCQHGNSWTVRGIDHEIFRASSCGRKGGQGRKWLHSGARVAIIGSWEELYLHYIYAAIYVYPVNKFPVDISNGSGVNVLTDKQTKSQTDITETILPSPRCAARVAIKTQLYSTMAPANQRCIQCYQKTKRIGLFSRHTAIGVGAQSTLGRRHFCPKNVRKKIFFLLLEGGGGGHVSPHPHPTPRLLYLCIKLRRVNMAIVRAAS